MTDITAQTPRLSRDEQGLLHVDGSARTELAHPGLSSYDKIPVPVTAIVTDVAVEITVSWQETPLLADVGCWIVNNADGSQHPVQPEIFAATYEHMPDGRYVKTAAALAVQIHEPFVVETLEGKAQAAAGSWLVQGAAGEAWPIRDETFRSTYVIETEVSQQ